MIPSLLSIGATPPSSLPPAALRCPPPPPPLSRQLGWLNVQQFNSSGLRAGAALQVRLNSQAVTPRSGLRIVPDWANGTDPIFLGYRTAERGDVSLSGSVAQRVSIYSAAITGG